MNILSWVIFGIVMGIVANFLDPRPSEGGIFGAILLGIVGAFLGGIVANVVLGTTGGTFNFSTLSVAVLGSLLLLLIGRAVRRI